MTLTHQKIKKDTAMLKKINEYLNLVNDEVMNALTDVHYIEDRCTVVTYVREGKIIVESTGKRTEPQGLATLYTIMNESS